MTILEEIIEVKKEEVKKLKQNYTHTRFSDSPHFDNNTFGFYEKVKADKNISIIAEIKKASPSKGIIRNDFDPVEIAKIYMDNEVQAISILTDKNFFQGSIDYLNKIAQFKTVPLLRKDFIIDEYQVYEARSNGADIILLISEILSQNQIEELTCIANELGLEVLLELHSEKELEKIDLNKNKIIGINNRDLHTFNVDINKSINISKLLPGENLIVAESGFKTKTDLNKIINEKISAVLIGEQFMASKKINEEIIKFRGWCKRES